MPRNPQRQTHPNYVQREQSKKNGIKYQASYESSKHNGTPEFVQFKKGAIEEKKVLTCRA